MSDPLRTESDESVSPTDAPAPDTSQPSAIAPSATSTGFLAVLVIGGMLAGALGVMFLRSSAEGTATAASAPGSRTAPRPASGTPERAASTTPRWTGGVHQSRGRSVAVFELEADRDVAMWGKVVRPVLTVRCIAGTTEVFVLTQSAAALEENDGSHTVQVGFDEEQDASERWLASADYDALFAENGAGAVRRISRARTMRFGFTPYNASPVVATFTVDGFARVSDALARTCRWK